MRNWETGGAFDPTSKEPPAMKLTRHAPVDDPVLKLAAGIWVAAAGFVAGFLGYVVLVPVS